jgi:hypothetical protein
MTKSVEKSKRPIRDIPMVLGVAPQKPGGHITARMAGGLRDMMLPISPTAQPVDKALQNLAKAINIALQEDFLETELDCAYKAARVKSGAVYIQHRDYIGLGDGFVATLGRLVKSVQLTLRGPDPASPEGRKWIEANKSSPVKGLMSLMGRKLDLIQEYEDQVPTYVEQTLDRLEAANIVTGWNRTEWDISTEVVGLDVVIRPKTEKKR